MAHKPTSRERKQVEALAGYGIQQHEIAALIGVDPKTLRKHYRKELDVGSAKATAKVAETLYKQAVNGNTAAAIFWMKARAGWSEKTKHELTGPDGRPLETVVILPAKDGGS